ncbi:MAG TPA: flagellar biosynthesis [Syntrophomonadaceae bacterium]|nr:flagellar biosynthesis [Syntrophomonadaceae bacterium]
MEDDLLRRAVALKYEKEQDAAPRVVAAGQGEIANRIIEQASTSGVPLYQDGSLASLLVNTPLNTEIPFELYESVAEVLLFVYRLDQRLK